MRLVIGVILELAGHAAAYHGQGLGANLLGKTEELIESQAVALVIVRELTLCKGVVPAVHVDRTVLYRTYAVLPLVTLLKGCTLYNAASRKTQHTRLKLSQSLGNIGSQAVLIIVISIYREERDMLQIHAAVLAVLHILILAPGLKINPECSIGYGLGGGKHHLIFLPIRACNLNHLIVEHLILILGIIIAQMEGNELLLGGLGFLAERRCTCPHCESVLFTLLNAHAEVALVLQAAEHHGMSGVT